MLEQAHDTKELNRVQRRLMARGKLVGNFVNRWVTVRLARVLSKTFLRGSVDQASSLRTPLPGYQRVFPHVRSMSFRSGYMLLWPTLMHHSSDVDMGIPLTHHRRL
jgi:hypothetical protein